MTKLFVCALVGIWLALAPAAAGQVVDAGPGSHLAFDVIGPASLAEVTQAEVDRHFAAVAHELALP